MHPLIVGALSWGVASSARLWDRFVDLLEEGREAGRIPATLNQAPMPVELLRPDGFPWLATFTSSFTEGMTYAGLVTLTRLVHDMAAILLTEAPSLCGKHYPPPGSYALS